MKKFFAGLTAVMLILQTAAFAELEPGGTADELAVSGKGGGDVTFVLLDADNLGTADTDMEKTIKETIKAYKNNVDKGIKMTTNEIFYFGTVKAENGVWSTVIPMKDVETKNLVLLASTGEEDYVSYASVEYRKNIVPILKQAAADGDEALVKAITDNIGFICDNAALYNKLKNKGNVGNLAKASITALDPNDDNVTANLKILMNKAVIISGVSEGVFDDFDKIAVYANNEDDLIKALTEKGKTDVVTVLAGKNYESFEKFDRTLLLALAINGFYQNKNVTGENLSLFISKYNKYIDLNLSAFNNLSETNRAKAAKMLCNKGAADKEGMQRNLNEIINEINASSDPSTPPLPVGGGGGRGGGAYMGSANTSVSQDNLIEQKYAYPDMKDAEWAVDAVLYLSQNGIVSGYGDNTFRPNNKITRAEFTKLIVKAFIGDVHREYESVFKDVNSGDWFSAVVNAAYNEGIVSGDDNGYFNPNDMISRQDMAVIVYNAGKKFNLFDKVENYNAFVDDNKISDYAKEAVYTLRSYSVIRGIGDGLFAPTDNADRASAAQMIYSLITKLDK